MLLSQEARKENKLSTLKQLFDHLRQKEHRMNIFNVVIAINRVQTDSYQSEFSNSNHRDRENARDRDETKDNFRNERSQSNQNDDNHSLQNIKCYQCEKKKHMSRNCFEKKKNDSNFNTENSEFRSNSNQNSNQDSNQNKRSNSNSMFVEYVDNSIEITHNQLSTQISDIV